MRRRLAALALMLASADAGSAAAQSRLTIEPASPSQVAPAPGPTGGARVQPAPRSSLRMQPAAPSGGATEAMPRSAVRSAPAPGSSLGSAEAVLVSRVAITPITASGLSRTEAAVSQARIAALPVSIAALEAVGGSSVREDQLKSELGAVETERGTLVSLPGDVLFDFDEATIRRDARPVLATLAELIDVQKDRSVVIEGHTDAKGSESYNQRLSERRAQSVAAYLARRHGIQAARLREEGKGETAPRAPNTRPDGADDPDGRQRNRRVEVILLRE